MTALLLSIAVAGAAIAKKPTENALGAALLNLGISARQAAQEAAQASRVAALLSSVVGAGTAIAEEASENSLRGTLLDLGIPAGQTTEEASNTAGAVRATKSARFRGGSYISKATYWLLEPFPEPLPPEPPSPRRPPRTPLDRLCKREYDNRGFFSKNTY